MGPRVLPLREALIPKLREAFPSMGIREDGPYEPLAVVPAKHPEVGDLVLQDGGDEITVYLGRITHRHFFAQDSEASADASVQAEQIAAEVTEYLRQLLADEIEFYGNGRSGGARSRSAKRRGFLSRLLFGRRTYLWSGPIEK